MKTTKIEESAENVLTEFRDPEELARGGKIKTQRFRTTDSFFMKVKNGPLIGVQPGTIIDLWRPESISDLFYSKKIIPILPPVPPVSVYRVISSFVTILDGEYLTVHRGQELRLNQEEALELLRLRRVLPLDENVFHL